MKQNNFIVVGDTILDRFIYGDAVRISPEAPALVLDVKAEKHIVGGAFNAFAHIRNLGGSVKLISVTGGDIDKYVEDFAELTNHQEDFILLRDTSRITSIKTRLVAYYKLSYLARFDKESTAEISDAFVDRILEYTAEHLNENSSLLIIDYHKGVITGRLSEELIKLARLRQAKVYVDSKKDEIQSFAGAYLYKPNNFEFQRVKLRYQLSDKDDVSACKLLMDRFDMSNIVVTLGARGMFAVSRDGQMFSVQGKDVNIKELSGAGDTVLPVLSTLLAEQYTLERALEGANNVAAHFVSSGISYKAKREDLFSIAG